MKRVLVSVFSIQRDMDGKAVKSELVSAGKYYEKHGARYFVYKESEITGMEGVTTVIKLQTDGTLILLRLGKIRQKQEYAVGKVKKSLYETPFGDIEVSMKTYEIKVDMVDGIGRIYLAYDVLLGELTSTYNQLFMEIREDRA